ncbi:hypothetical protein FNV43_RR21449 [Rhamnella rubrinervis]|uniref:Protein kinase n=1 Tax=Rhamnella rubrinervis TaxID=2594499 RepID=A0A8K0GXQ6_9ROSA|nr:hypothetical protein FNV43_RR21449 [Rhamnella rubrinervis]
MLQSSNLKRFSFADLKMTTRNFRLDSVLGEGGFGSVFKGWMDENSFTAAKPGTGMVIAVKRLNQKGLQGHKEWLVGLGTDNFVLASKCKTVIIQDGTCMLKRLLMKLSRTWDETATIIFIYRLVCDLVASTGRIELSGTTLSSSSCEIDWLLLGSGTLASGV